MPRTTVTIGDVNLARTSVFLSVPISGAKAMQIFAQRISGTWATRTLEVKKKTGIGAAESFSSARTFAAGGGPAIALSETDLAGLSELEVEAGGATETGLVRLTAAIEFDATTAEPGQFRQGNINEGPSSAPIGGFPEA